MSTITSITVPADALYQVISDTRRFASTDSDYSPLCAVHLSTGAGHLFAMGTDRFAMAWSRQKVEVESGFTASLAADDIDQWRDVLTDKAGTDVTITVVDVPHQFTPDILLSCGARTIRRRAAGGLGVDLAPFVSAIVGARPIAQRGIHIDPEKLAPFTDVAIDHQPPPSPLEYDEDGFALPRRGECPFMAIATINGDRGPMLRVSVGDDFVGLLMAVNHRTAGLWADLTEPDVWRWVAPLVLHEEVPA